jgi:hypothetical protein
MPKTRKNTYVVDGKKYTTFAAAAARAVDLSLQTESQEVTVVRAEAEQVG